MTRTPCARSVQIHGPALRHVREQQGRTIGQLARAVGVSTGFLSRVELGVKRGVGVEVFHLLVQELHLVDPRVLAVNPYAATVIQLTSSPFEQDAPTVLSSSSTPTRAA